MEFMAAVACDLLDMALDALLNPVFNRFGALASKCKRK